jgi:hypothetical protein
MVKPLLLKYKNGCEHSMGQPHKHGKNENNSAAVKAKMEQVTGQTDLVNMLIN